MAYTRRNARTSLKCLSWYTFSSYIVLHTHTRGKPDCCDLHLSWSGPYQVCCYTGLPFLLEHKHWEVYKKKHSSAWLANTVATTLRNSVVKFKSLISQKSATMNYEPEVDEDEYKPLRQVSNVCFGCWIYSNSLALYR